MATQLNQPFSGRIGSVIFYQLNGKQAARSMPRKVKQSKATKGSATRFGLAAALARGLRDGLTPIYTDLMDRGLMNRLNTSMVYCLGSGATDGPAFAAGLPHLEGFQFNAEKELPARMKKPVTARFDRSGLLVSIPPLNVPEDLRAPAGTREVILRIGACSVKWSDTQVAENYYREIIVPYKEGIRLAEELLFPVALKKGRLVALAVAVRFSNGRQFKAINEKREWMPAAVVGAWWTGREAR